MELEQPMTTETPTTETTNRRNAAVVLGLMVLVAAGAVSYSIWFSELDKSPEAELRRIMAYLSTQLDNKELTVEDIRDPEFRDAVSQAIVCSHQLGATYLSTLLAKIPEAANNGDPTQARGYINLSKREFDLRYPR